MTRSTEMEIYIAADMAADIQAVMDTTGLYTDMAEFVADGLRHLYVGLNRDPELFARGLKEMEETYDTRRRICVMFRINGALVVSLRSRGFPPESMAAAGAYLMMRELGTTQTDEIEKARRAIEGTLFRKG